MGLRTTPCFTQQESWGRCTHGIICQLANEDLNLCLFGKMCFYLHFVGQLVVSCAFLFVLECHVLLTPPCYSCLINCCLFAKTLVANVCWLVDLWVFKLSVRWLRRVTTPANSENTCIDFTTHALQILLILILLSKQTQANRETNCK